MTAPDSAHLATWLIAALAVSGVIVRPWRIPESVWVVLGALALVIFGLLPWHDALFAIGKGTDVYLFLTGMMLLSELARREGLFDFLAALAVRQSRGSASRLFLLAYAIGTVVTVFMSNDATAVVLTPAVYAAAKQAKAKPLPYLFVCAFIANAASFVLPISNPANLVLYGSHMPSLGAWLAQFTLPSAFAIGATFVALRVTQRHRLRGAIKDSVPLPRLSAEGKLAAGGIAVMACGLLVASALSADLGAPTFCAGVLTAAVVSIRARRWPLEIVRGVSWSVLPLVAGLFVLVAGLEHTGVINGLAAALHQATERSVTAAAWECGLFVAFASNLINNLPAGLIAASTSASAHAPNIVIGALLIGVDLGPNLSVTGSLATILWLVALRREQQHVGAIEFLKVGVVVMVPALILALAALIFLQAQ